MPHKRNPIGAEQIVGLARLLRGNAHAALREHRAVARARHLALLGRARHPARQLHRPRSHAAPHDPDRARDGGLRRAHAREPEPLARRRLLRHGAARAGEERRLARAGLRVGAAQRDAVVCRAARFQDAAARRSRRHAACCRRPRSSAPSTSTSSSSTSTISSIASSIR